MSRRRERRQRRLAILNFAIALAAVAVVGFAVYALQPKPFDPQTLCLISEETPPHTAIIIDKTDEYTVEQAELIAGVIRRARDRLAVGEKFTLFELDQDGKFDPRGEFLLCNPGRGSQVNPLFRNPEMVEKRYATLFDAPLERALADLVTPKEAPRSPIIEALARLGQTEAFSNNVPRRRVVLISDMLQNSDLFSAYGGRGAMPASTPPVRETSRAIETRFGDALRGVELEIRLIPRDSHVDVQRGPLRAYWDQLFVDLGVIADWGDL